MPRHLGKALREARIKRASLPELRAETREELVDLGYIREAVDVVATPAPYVTTDARPVLHLDAAGRAEAERVIAHPQRHPDLSNRRHRRQKATDE